jgi:hypothetical protein
VGASPLVEGSGAKFQLGEVVISTEKQADPEQKFVVVKTPSSGKTYKLAYWRGSFSELREYLNLDPRMWIEREEYKLRSTGKIIPEQLEFELEPTPANLFKAHPDIHSNRDPGAKKDWKLELEPTTTFYTDDSPVLDCLIKEAIAILGRQEDWDADYAGYRSKRQLWEVRVENQNGKFVGSLYFERTLTDEDFDAIDPNENLEYLGEHEGYWWCPDENLETELYDRDLIRDLERLAQPFWKPVHKSCSINAVGPEVKALIAAINNLPPLPTTKNSDPQEYEAYWDVQDGNRQGLHIGFCPPNALLGHIELGYSESDRHLNLMLDNVPYHLGGKWYELLSSPGRYQALADLLNGAIAKSQKEVKTTTS